MVRVSGREYNGLIDSPCYERATETARTLTCFSCHSMHIGADDRRGASTWAAAHQVSPGMETNAACLSCHKQFRTNATTHTRHQNESSGSRCYNCHMPYTSYGLLKALRSHQISSPSVTASVQTGRPNACNACHLDKTLGWTATISPSGTERRQWICPTTSETLRHRYSGRSRETPASAR
jgi:formate-dependent nitrite reductase cytochrome c552 subunit